MPNYAVTGADGTVEMDTADSRVPSQSIQPEMGQSVNHAWTWNQSGNRSWTRLRESSNRGTSLSFHILVG